MKIIDKSNYKDVVYLSHPYGGKKDNLDEVNECQRLLTIMYPENLYLNPIAMFGSLYYCTSYEQGLSMTLFLLEELADRMVICSDNYMYSKGCLAEIAYCSEREIPYKYLTLSQIKKEYEKYIKEHNKNG